MRILIGTVALTKALVLLQLVPRLLAPESLRVPWTGVLPQLDMQAVQSVLVVWLAAAAAFIAGWRFRVAAWVLAASIAAVLASDQQFFQNHVYLLLVLVLLMGFSGADHSLSRQARSLERVRTPHGWPVVMIQWQISVVYAFGALSKLNLDYLSGATTAGAWLNGALGSWLVGFAGSTGMVILSVSSVAIELWLAYSLLSLSRRRAAIVVGVIFHGALIATIPERVDLTIFSLLMFSAYLPRRSTALVFP